MYSQIIQLYIFIIYSIHQYLYIPYHHIQYTTKCCKKKEKVHAKENKPHIFVNSVLIIRPLRYSSFLNLPQERIKQKITNAHDSVN